MTDFAKPTTPGDALRVTAKEIEYREKRLRRDAEKLLAQAEELAVARMDIERDADRWDQYQPAAKESLPAATNVAEAEAS